jgi:hypothetical protein
MKPMKAVPSRLLTGLRSICLICGVLQGSLLPAQAGPASPISGSNKGPGPAASLRRFNLEIGDYRGISDLVRDANGSFWAIPERQRALLQLRLAGDHPGLESTPVPVRGMSTDVDFESLACLPDGRFVAGTETQRSNRSSDLICILRIDQGVAHVTDQISMPYKLWDDMRAHANDGIEGLCAVDSFLFAAVESAQMSSSGQRYAPLGRYHLDKKTWETFGIQLSTRIGKVSAITCRPDPQDAKRIELLAIERHFGVSRLLRVRIPMAKDNSTTPTLLIPEVVIDFTRYYASVPNLEGLAWASNGDLYIISDNDFGRVSGPTQVLVVPASRLH